MQDIYTNTLSEYSPTSLGKDFLRNSWEQVKSAVLPAGMGAAGGAALASASGQDPIKGAMYGAAGTMAATKGAVLQSGANAALLGAGRIA